MQYAMIYATRHREVVEGDEVFTVTCEWIGEPWMPVEISRELIKQGDGLFQKIPWRLAYIGRRVSTDNPVYIRTDCPDALERLVVNSGDIALINTDALRTKCSLRGLKGIEKGRRRSIDGTPCEAAHD